ncbi:AAA family ATPase [Alkalicoccus urumqiensis]|nr:AAA family ATPase [Alkalicoccus urumqiensis]
MKLLRIQVDGHTFFKDHLVDMDFIARDRVTEEYEVNHLFGSIYTKTAMAVCGVNASGKTTLLEVLRTVTNIFVNGRSVREFIQADRYLANTVFTIWFYQDNAIYELRSQLKKVDKKWLFEEEELRKKPVSRGNTRKKLFVFTDKDLLMKRSKEDTRFLPDDVTMLTSLLKHSKTEAIDHMHYTEHNELGISGDIPTKFTQLLDPSIEYIRRDPKQEGNVCMKFHGRPEITVPEEDQQLYLSSGTVKGLNFLGYGYLALQSGGYFIVDEIENHFHKAIVEILLHFFADPEVNAFGATLIFSTHYVEILESMDRKDTIYITRKTEEGITVGSFSSENVRNDMKKSDLFLSNRLEGTAPSYSRYMELKRDLVKNIQSKVEETV